MAHVLAGRPAAGVVTGRRNAVARDAITLEVPAMGAADGARAEIVPATSLFGFRPGIPAVRVVGIACGASLAGSRDTPAPVVGIVAGRLCPVSVSMTGEPICATGGAVTLPTAEVMGPAGVVIAVVTGATAFVVVVTTDATVCFTMLTTGWVAVVTVFTTGARVFLTGATIGPAAFSTDRTTGPVIFVTEPTTGPAVLVTGAVIGAAAFVTVLAAFETVVVALPTTGAVVVATAAVTGAAAFVTAAVAGTVALVTAVVMDFVVFVAVPTTGAAACCTALVRDAVAVVVVCVEADCTVLVTGAATADTVEVARVVTVFTVVLTVEVAGDEGLDAGLVAVPAVDCTVPAGCVDWTLVFPVDFTVETVEAAAWPTGAAGTTPLARACPREMHTAAMAARPSAASRRRHRSTDRRPRGQLCSGCISNGETIAGSTDLSPCPNRPFPYRRICVYLIVGLVLLHLTHLTCSR